MNKSWWRQQARRIDALTLRERAIMFVSLAAALVAVADTLVLSPRMAEQKALASALRRQSGELQALRQQLAGNAEADTPQGRLARTLRELQAQQQQADASLARQAAGGSSTDLPALMERVLRRQDGLTLLRLDATAPGAPGATAGAASTATTTGQAVELGVAGRYADLLRYVEDAEATLPGLRWASVALSSTSADGNAERGLPVLSARVVLPGMLPGVPR